MAVSSRLLLHFVCSRSLVPLSFSRFALVLSFRSRSLVSLSFSRFARVLSFRSRSLIPFCFNLFLFVSLPLSLSLSFGSLRALLALFVFCALFALLGAFWVLLGAFWVRWGAFWLLLGAFWVPLGLFWDSLGALLGRSWAVLGGLGAVWGRSSIFGRFLVPFWRQLGSPKAAQKRPKRNPKISKIEDKF